MTATNELKKTVPVVAIAASAGGIPALQTVLRSLPSGLQAAVIVVQHRTARSPERLTAILQRCSELPVKPAKSGDVLEPGTVYVAPPDQHVRIKQDHSLELSDGRRIAHVLSSADPLFESLGQASGSHGVAVVLSGSGRNGATGVPSVRAAGGAVIAQDRETSAYFGMPAAAIATGAVDKVLPIQDIGPAVIDLVRRMQ